MSEPDFIAPALPSQRQQPRISSANWAEALFGVAPEPPEPAGDEPPAEVEKPSVSDLFLEAEPSVPAEEADDPGLTAPDIPDLSGDPPNQTIPKFTSDMLARSSPDAVGHLMDLALEAEVDPPSKMAALNLKKRPAVDASSLEATDPHDDQQLGVYVTDPVDE